MSRRPEWWLTFLAKLWPLTWISARATHWPVVGPFVEKITLPLFSGKNLHISYIPVNVSLTGFDSVPLPAAVGEELIRRSAHRVIIHRCTCRDARQCSRHPIDYGCTLLGEGTREIDPRIARHVSREEAIAHLHRTIADGLVPMTGRVRIDNWIWGVRDLGRLQTICHCCHCCCTILTSGRYLPAEAAGAIVPLKGLDIAIDDIRCSRCGLCVDACHMGAMHFTKGRIERDAGRCIGCGACSSACPANAIRLEIADMETAISELTSRIGGLVDISRREKTGDCCGEILREGGIMDQKGFWYFLMGGAILLWIAVAVPVFLTGAGTVLRWGPLGAVALLHLAEIPFTVKIGRSRNLSAMRTALKTFVFGFTWWLPVKRGIFRM